MSILLIFVGTLLSTGLGIHQFFTLRNELDPGILKTLNAAEENLSERLLVDRKYSKLSSPQVIPLKPLFFHIDSLAVQVSNMHLTCSEFMLKQSNVDVLGHRMMPVVYFPWVEINGKLKTGLNTNLPQKFDFQLVQNYLNGSGVLSLTVDLSGVLWSYFNLRPNSSSFELKNSREGDSDQSFKVLNTSLFSELLSKKLQRDINYQLSAVISQNINNTLKKPSKLTNLQPEYEELSNIGINNTDNANLFIDNILKVGGALIRGKFGDRIGIPDIDEKFSEKFIVTFRGSFSAKKGAAIGTSSVHRKGDVVFGYDNESLLHFYGTLGFKSLHLSYGYYKAEMWNVGPSGTMTTTLAPLSVLVHINLNTTSKMIDMQMFKIVDAGDLSLSLTGLGGWFNWLMSRVTTWVVGLYRDQVLHLLESQYEQYGKEVFATYSMEELLSGEKIET